MKTSHAADDIRALFLGQIEEQREEAEKHRLDLYWTDMNTGRNVSVDEYEAIYQIENIDLEQTDDERLSPRVYADRLISDLTELADRYRSTALDPDGYGIATIGTVMRNLKASAFSTSDHSSHGEGG